MQYRLEITMQGERLLSRNQLDQMTWRKRHRRSKRIKTDVWVLSNRKRPTSPLERSEVTITSNRKRLLDPDNLVGGCKAYIDALKTNGIIQDDRPENIRLKTRQAIDTNGYSVKITVIEQGAM